ncbi:zinc ribbon domain-containing protein [Streptomyces sp. NPDC001984]
MTSTDVVLGTYRVWSNEPAHEAIISPNRFAAVQTLRRQRARNHGRQERAGKQGGRPYALRGRVRCSLCGRKMQPATIRNSVYYRCEFKDQEEALYPDLTHPRTVNLREDIVCQALDQWIARASAPDRLTATITVLSHASAAASTAETHTPEQTQARQAIKDRERRLARYQAALEAGVDPAVVTQWINHAQRDKEAARKKLDALPAVTRKKEPPLDAQQIREITESLGDIAQRIHTASTEKKGPLYEALGITISYEKPTRTATVRSRPSSAYRQWVCPRGELTTNDTVVVPRGRLRLLDPPASLRQSHSRGDHPGSPGSSLPRVSKTEIVRLVRGAFGLKGVAIATSSLIPM